MRCFAPLLLLALAGAVSAQTQPLIRWMRGGHINRISGLSYSPDGTKFVSGGYDDDTVKIWQTSNGHLLKTVQVTQDRANTVLWSPDGQRIAMGGYDGRILIFDGSGQFIRQWQAHSLGTGALRFTSDSQTLVSSGYDGTVKIWNPNAGSLIGTINTGSQYTYGIDISPDNQTLVVAMENSNAQVWNLPSRTKTATLTGFSNGTVGVDISPNGQYVAVSGGNTSNVRIYNFGTWSVFRTLTPDNFDSIACEFTPDSQRIVTNGFRGTYCFVVATGARLWYNDFIGESMDVRPDGQQVLTGTSGFEALNYINLTDANTGALQLTASVADDPASAVAISPDSSKVAMGTSAFDSKVGMFRIGNGERIFSAEYSQVSDGVRDVRFSPDGTKIAASGGKGWTKIFDSTTGAQLALLDDGLTSPVTVGGVDFSPDGQLAATATDARWVSLWDANSGQLLQRFSLLAPGFALRFSPDGQTLALGVNTMLQIRDLAGNMLRLYAFDQAVGRVAFSKDGFYVAAASQDGTARVFRFSDLAPVSPLLVHGRAVNGLCFSPDGKRLVTGSSDATVRVWSVTGTELARYNRETGVSSDFLGVNDVYWSPNGKTISFVRGDGSLVTIAAPAVRANVGSGITPDSVSGR